MEQLNAATNTDISPTSNTPNAQNGQDALGKQDTREWVCPGVSVRKRWLTGIGVAMASAVFFFIALWEGASMLVSTLIGIVFIGGFIGYLRVVAPTPFTIRLDAEGVTYREVDIGGDPALEARYREWLPVVEIDGERAFVYRIPVGSLRRKLGTQS